MATTDVSTDKIRVRIQASQRVRYDQVVEMDRDEWQRIKKLRDKEFASTLSDWLDLRDVNDGDEFESDEVEGMVVDENGKPVKPADNTWL